MPSQKVTPAITVRLATRPGLTREESGEIVAFALEFRSHAGARRGRNARHLFHLDLALLVHPKIRFTCSIPRTSAAMSELSLCAAKLARAVASIPSARIRG